MLFVAYLLQVTVKIITSLNKNKNLISDAIEGCVIQDGTERQYDCLIFDGMIHLQQLTSVQLSMFGEVAEYLLRSILKRKFVYFVTDQYKDGSIKSRTGKTIIIREHADSNWATQSKKTETMSKVLEI